MVEYKIGDLEAIHLYKCIRKKHIINNKMENYSTLIIPLILDAIGLVIYFCLMADWKKKIRPSTYTMCLLFFVMILAAPMVWFSTLFLMDHPSSMMQFWIVFFAINSYPLFLILVDFACMPTSTSKRRW